MFSTISSPLTITQKITSFLEGQIFLSTPFRSDWLQDVRIRNFVYPLLSEIRLSTEIQEACTKIETSLTGSYLANQVINLHPVVNDKDIKIHLFVKPGVDKESLYYKVNTIAKKHLMNQVVPKEFVNFDCELRDIGVLKDTNSPVKGMRLGSISLMGEWGEVPLELSIIISDESCLSHLTNVDSLYVPLQAFDNGLLGSDAPGEFVLRSREGENVETVLSDLHKRIITSAKMDWNPAEVSYFELARYFIWIVERWTEPMGSVFSCFARGSLEKLLPPKILWDLFYKKVREKRSMFSSYPFFLTCNFLFHFSPIRNPSWMNLLEADFTKALEGLREPFRSVHSNLQKILYIEKEILNEKSERVKIVRLKSDALFLLSCYLPILSQKILHLDHLGNKILQCCFQGEGKEFAVIVPIPQDTEEFKLWISEIIAYPRKPKILHIIYLLQNEVLGWIIRSFHENNEKGFDALSQIFDVISRNKKPFWAAEILLQLRETDLSLFVPKCLSLLETSEKWMLLQNLAIKQEGLFFQIFPYFQNDFSLSRKEILAQLIEQIDSPSFYQRYIELCEDPSEKLELIKYVFDRKGDRKDSLILNSILSLLPEKEKTVFLAEHLNTKEIASWRNHLYVLTDDTQCLDLMEQLFLVLDEEKFFEGLLQVQQCIPVDRQEDFGHALITRLVPKLQSASPAFQSRCREKIGASSLSWLRQVFLSESEETFFQALAWIDSFFDTNQKRSVFISDLMTYLLPDLRNVPDSFWIKLEPVLSSVVVHKKAWQNLFYQFIMELSVFPECLRSLVDKSGLSAVAHPISVQNWIFNLKFSIIQRNSLYVKSELKENLSQDKLNAINVHFSSSKLLKPLFVDLLENRLWKEAFALLNNLKTVFGAEEVLSWYVEFAKKNPEQQAKIDKACLRAVRESWSIEKSWRYYAVVSSLPLVTSWLTDQGFYDPIDLSKEEKEGHLSRVCASLPLLIEENKVQSALALAIHLPSLEPQESEVSALLIHLFEKCTQKEERVVVANLMQKLAPNLTLKLVKRFQNPYMAAASDRLPISRNFPIDLWMISFLEACLEENVAKQKMIFSWMGSGLKQFLVKFPDDFPRIARKYVLKMSAEEKEIFSSAATSQIFDPVKLNDLLQKMTLIP